MRWDPGQDQTLQVRAAVGPGYFGNLRVWIAPSLSLEDLLLIELSEALFWKPGKILLRYTVPGFAGEWQAELFGKPVGIGG